MTIDLRGFENTMLGFKKIKDESYKEGAVRRAERRAAKPFLVEVKRRAITALNDTGELSNAFSIRKRKIRVTGKDTWIDTVVSAKNKKASGKFKSQGMPPMTYPALASVYNKGTKIRKHDSGKAVGQIEPTWFINKAFTSKQRTVRKLLSIQMQKELIKTTRRYWHEQAKFAAYYGKSYNVLG